MGYYTNYSLKQEGCPKQDLLILESEVDKMRVFSDGDAEYGWATYAKWYDFDNDMVKLSAKFPDVVFTLDGVGEDSDDEWRHYYKHGMVQYRALEIRRTIHDFDESKLGPPLGGGHRYESGIFV